MDANSIITSFDDVTLYYTFSTIAQTLAAAFAFVGAFVLFRVQHLDQLCRKMADKLEKTLTDSLNVRKLFMEENWVAMVETFEQNKITQITNAQQNSNTPVSENSAANQAKKNIEEMTPSPYKIKNFANEKNKIIFNFKMLAITCTINISMSLALLPFTKMISNFTNVIAPGILISLSIFTVANIGNCAWVVFDALPKPYKFKKEGL